MNIGIVGATGQVGTVMREILGKEIFPLNQFDSLRHLVVQGKK